MVQLVILEVNREKSNKIHLSFETLVSYQITTSKMQRKDRCMNRLFEEDWI